MELEFDGEIWFWRGPAPFHFVTLPEPESRQVESVSRQVSYGWGMIPVVARVGGTEWETAMFAKDGGYVLPVKAQVRRAEGLELGEVVTVGLTIDESLRE
jgi:hypothetical protein